MAHILSAIIYALFPPIIMNWKAESANFFAFRMYACIIANDACTSLTMIYTHHYSCPTEKDCFPHRLSQSSQHAVIPPLSINNVYFATHMIFLLIFLEEHSHFRKSKTEGLYCHHVDHIKNYENRHNKASNRIMPALKGKVKEVIIK